MKIIARGANDVLVAELTTHEFYHLLGHRFRSDGDKTMKELGFTDQNHNPRFIGAHIDLTERFLRVIALEERYKQLAGCTETLRAMATIIDGLAKDSLSITKEPTVG